MYLDLKLKLVKGLSFENYKSIEVKKKHKEEAKADEETEDDKEVPVPLVTQGNKFLLSTFQMLKYTSTFTKITIQMDCVRPSLTSPTTSRGLSLNSRGFCIARGTIMKNFLTNLWNRLCLNLSSQGEWKCLADPMA